MQANKLVADYSSLKVDELRALCKKRNIRGVYKLPKKELVNKLLTWEDADISDEYKPTFTPIVRTKYPILNHLVEKKKLILLQKCIGKQGQPILYHNDTSLVFATSVEKKINKYTVIGRFDEQRCVLPLDKSSIELCKEWDFEYVLPENLGGTIDNFQSKELEELLDIDDCVVESRQGRDEDDEEYLPDYCDMD